MSVLFMETRRELTWKEKDKTNQWKKIAKNILENMFGEEK